MAKKDEIVTNLDDLQGDTFTGKITDVKVGKSNPNQEDKVYITLVMDVDYMEDDYELYIPYSNKKMSVWGFFLKALVDDAGVKIKTPDDLKGESFLFERRDVVMRGGFVAKSGFPMPKEHLG